MQREQARCDSDPSVNPSRPEVCGDGIDNDCRGGDLVCPPPPDCERRAGPLSWSCHGEPVHASTDSCIAITESADREASAWNDNVLCGPSRLGLAWSSASQIPGKDCIKIYEDGQDPSETWNDNYLCWNKKAWKRDGYAFAIEWSQANAKAGWDCLNWLEPLESSPWNDNFLCWRYEEIPPAEKVCYCPDGFCTGADPSSQACVHICRAHSGNKHDHGGCELH